MKKRFKSLFSVLAALLLVLNTVTPFVSANTETTTKNILIDVGDESRTLQSAQLIATEENHTGYSSNTIYFYYNGEHLSAQLYNNIALDKNYRVTSIIEYAENDESYSYFEEVILSGMELSALANIQVPANDALQFTKLENDVADSGYISARIGFRAIDGYQVPSIYGYPEYTNIAVKKQPSPQLFITVQHYANEKDKENHYVAEDLTFNNEKVLLSDLYKNLVLVKYEQDFGVSFNNSIYNAYFDFNKSSYVSKGTYDVNYYPGNSRWSGKLTITEPMTLQLPTKIHLLEFTSFNVNPNYSKAEQLSIYYNVTAKNGDFTTYLPYDVPSTFKVLKDGKEVVSTKPSSNSSVTVDLGKNPTGKYTAELSLTVDDEVIKAQNEFDYTSPWQDLYGTVVTAENAQGEALTDARATLYQITETSSEYKEVYTSAINTEQNEIFIPDTYIQKEHSYLLIVKSDKEKIAYARYLNGHEEKEIHFAKDNLKEIKVNSGEMETVYSSVHIADSKYRIPLSIEVGWKVDTPFTYSVNWTGKTDDSAGYYYSGKLDDQLIVQVADVEWELYKPAAIYENAEIRHLSSPYSFKEVYVEKNSFKLFSISAKDNNISYHGQATIGENNELFFGNYEGEVTYATSDYIQLRFDNQSGNVIDLNIYGASFEYEIVGESIDSITVKTNDLSFISLSEALAPGKYMIRLLNTTVNEELIGLSLEQEFEVNGKQTSDLPEEITLASQMTPYGKVSDYMNGSPSFYIFKREQGNYYNQIASYFGNYKYSNSGQDSREFYYYKSYSNHAIEDDAMYQVFYTLSVGTERSVIVEKIELSGKELKEFVQKPLQVSNDLVEIDIDESVLLNNGLNFYVDFKGNGMRLLNFYLNKNAKMYMSKADVTIATRFQKNQELTHAVLFDGELKESTKLSLKSNLVKLEVASGKEPAKFFAFGVNNYTWHYNNYLDVINLSKGTYKNLMFGVVKQETLESAWGYMLRKNEFTISEDTKLQFNGEITGSIVRVNHYDSELYVMMQLNAGDNEVSSIHHAVNSSQNMMQSRNSIPVRPVYGVFDRMNEITIEYEVLDANNKVVLDGFKQVYGTGLWIDLPKTLEDGTYKVLLKVPTGPRKILTLEETFTIGGPAVQPIKITTISVAPYSNAEQVTVSGTAEANTALTASLKQGTTVIETKAIIATNGQFSVTFAPKADGNYTVEIANADRSLTATTSFVIDRTAPAKVTNIQFAETANGLTVSWNAASDAKGYKVQVAKDNEAYTTSAVQTSTTYNIQPVVPGATYKVRVIAIDEAGNESVSDEVTKQVPVFTTTAVSLEDKRNQEGYLILGDTLAITLEGSYKPEYKATAIVVVDGVEKQFALTYNEATGKYEGAVQVEGFKKIESLKGYIADGETKTNEPTITLNWLVGATVTGNVSDGEPFANATVRLENTTKKYVATTNEQGTFKFEGIQDGEYIAYITVNNQTTVLPGKVTVLAAERLEIPTITVPAYVSPTIQFVDSVEQKAIDKTFYVRIQGPNNFTAYGQIENGVFVPYTASQMKNIPAGDYTITVYGDGLYKQTTKTITFTKKETTYTFVVDKQDVSTKAITLKLPTGVTNVQSVSLYNYDIVKQFNYSGIGSYYDYNVAVKDGIVTINDVVAAKDYELYVSVEGYMPYQATVDLTATTEIDVVLEKGREISGTITDSQGNPIANQYVYAYGMYGYASATTDNKGAYKLVGLDKTADITLYVSSDVYLDVTEVIAKGSEDVEKNIQLAKAASITGKVVDKDGNPIATAWISASGANAYGSGRTAADGKFTVHGLNDSTTYSLYISAYGYPTLTVDDVAVGEDKEYILQEEGTGDFAGEGNYFSASKSTVVPGDAVQFTVAYKNNGTAEATDVPVAITVPSGYTLVAQSVQLNGKSVAVKDGIVTIPAVAANEAGKITFTVTVGDVTEPSLTATAKISEDGQVLTATVSVVFVTLEAPAQTATKNVKVYGTAKYGSTVEVYANNVLVGQTKVDSKWWYVDATLPVTVADEAQTFTLTAKVTDQDKTVSSKPVKVAYTPNVPTIKDVTVYAGWNGNVKLNPYTGIATFAITEHTPLDTTIVFDQDVDAVSLNFLGKTYEMKKGSNDAFTFDGNELGLWSSYGEQLLTVTFKKGDVEITLPLMNIIVLIDPSGFVFEDSFENRLQGVRAIVETKNAAGEWVIWDAEKFGQVNPQTTDADGRYGWDVINGEWRVIFTKEGYAPYISRVMTVPPAETELNVPMVKLADPIITTSEVSANDLTVVFDRYMQTKDVVKLYEVKGAERTAVAGTVELQEVNGYKAIAAPADKLAGFSGKDSNDEDGFFAVDAEKKLSKTFKFIPTAALKADTTYELVVSGDAKDAQGKSVGVDKVFAFTTDKATGGGTGGGSVGGGGGSTGGSPTTPTPEKDITQDLAQQLIDPTTNTVVVELEAPTAEASLAFTVTAAHVAAITQANKALQVKAGDVTLNVPVAVLKAIAATQADNVTVVLSVATNEAPENALSTAYDYKVVIEKDGKKTDVTALAAAIEISIAVDSVKNADKVAVYKFNDATKQWQFVIAKFDGEKLVFKTKQLGTFVVIENNKTFKDVENSWAKDYIEALASKSIIKGKTETAFDPNAQITRAQFASLLTRLLGLETTSFEGKFSDVSENLKDTAYEIEAAARAGIIQGADGKFNPSSNVSRQEMVTMIIRAMKYVDATSVEGIKGSVKFADASKIASYAKDNVAIATELGIINGMTVNGQLVFAPNDNATRAQAAKMLYIMLGNL